MKQVQTQSKASKMVKDFVRARNLKNNFGIKSAAGFLRNRGYSVEAAVYILTRTN